MLLNYYSNNKTITVTFYSLLFFLIFDYIFAFTIYESQMLIFFFMIFNLISFVYCGIKYGFESNNSARIWNLYLYLHIIGLCLNGNVSTIPYWIISLMILYMPSKIAGVFKPNIFIYIGLFFAGGVFFQYLFNDIYRILIFPLFINDASDFIQSSMSNEFGFSGFSPQTGLTAYILLICQSVILAFKGDSIVLIKKTYRYSILAIFILAIFLTGKRTPSMISIVLVLVFVYINESGNHVRNIFILLTLFLGCFLIIEYFIDNINYYSDNIFVKRFASSFNSASNGEDITSGRSELYKRAWILFSQEPVLGIGAGNFIKIGGMGTTVHNTYLQILCEEGFLRFFLFIIPLIVVFLKTIRKVGKNIYANTRSFLILSLLIQIIFILYSFTGNTIANNNNYVMYFMAVGFFTYAKTYTER